MKIFGKFLRKLTNESGKIEVTLEVADYQSKKLLEELNKKDNYKIEINAVKSKRSIEQNKMMWELLGQIAKKMNGDNDSIAVYTQALENVGAKYVWMMGEPKVEKDLKKAFRVVKMARKDFHNGIEVNVYQCFYGSSKMNVTEMNELLEEVLRMAEQCGIDTK